MLRMKPALAWALASIAFPAFAAASSPPSPDYSQPSAWAAYPGTPSAAEDVPAGTAAVAADKRSVPVFFIELSARNLRLQSREELRYDVGCSA